ncbi:MAG TPA: amino acid adenylation domain-containing protein, partial [Thermoanaerobaculia bacterium]|nr:amino acid adenylation domain-containing protein [Thermoanaerobaculia bacterium]
ELRLPPAETAALQAFARRHQLTRSALVSGAWAVLLARYGGAEDVVFGSVVSGRPPELPGVEEMVGLFINTLPVRVAARGGARLGAWLAGDLQAAAARLQERAHDPLAAIQQASELPPGSPLFETLVVFENYPLDAALRERSGSLAVSEVRSLEHSNYPLTLVVSPGVELSLRAAYDRDRLDGATTERLLAHLATLLAGMTADPDQADLRLDELSLLTAAERHQILAQADGAAADPAGEAGPEAGDTPLHLLFARQAARTPDAVAVTDEGQAWTYSGLAARSSQLARRLRDLGLAAGEVVGLYLDRSALLIEGMLGVLAAGGAYLPLDPVQPEERLAFVLNDAGVRLVLTGGGLGQRLIERLRAGRTTLDLDQPHPQQAVLSGWEEGQGLGVDGLAYVIYTSGSTGRPKGALLTHRNAARLFRATRPWFGFGPSDVWTLFHSPAFDFSVWEIWGALLHGGRLVVVPYWVSRAPDRFLALLADEQVTVLNQTPSAFGQLLRAEEEAAGTPRHPILRPALRLVIFGGEALDPRTVAPWLAGEGRPRLVNMYGITETTVHVTYRPLTPADAADASTAGSPIGEPIPDLTLAVLDVHGQPAPIGAPGELQVGGPGLAVGYLGRPELTAERFVPDPAAALPGARLYRSGDLVRRGEDGGLDYLGRADRQVKIRGFRIEPGEIEAALLAHPDVGAVAVVVREEAAGGLLVAYVVASQGENKGAVPPDLRADLERRLPAYMVPVLVAVDELPLTANGKVDRAALARRELPAGAGGSSAGDGYVPPRTPLEELLAGIWADVLRQPRVGAEAHFFALGGSSILSLQVVSRCRRAGLEVSPRDLFEAPVLADLATRLASARRPASPPIRPLPRGVPQPLSFAQERLWFLDQLEPGNAAYNIPAAFLLSGPFDAAVFEASLGEVARRQGSLRTVFRADGQGPVQVVGEPVPVAVPRVDLAGLRGPRRDTELQRLVLGEARRGFDLARGPLWRAVLVPLGENEAVLLVTLHHIIGDGWSVGVLVREVAALYRVLLAGEPARLPALPIQYTDFAVWQRQLLAGETGHGADHADLAELAYW